MTNEKKAALPTGSAAGTVATGLTSHGTHYSAFSSARDPKTALFAAAHLLHAQSFDPVPLRAAAVMKLAYEARWSESCPACGAIWVGSKAGEVVQIELHPDGPKVHSTRIDSGVRTLLHVHGGAAFGDASLLLVGDDDGNLHRLHLEADHDPKEEQTIHIESWWNESGGRAIPFETSIACPGEDWYTAGVTALSPLQASAAEGQILIATRSGALFLLVASDRTMHLRQIRRASGGGAEMSGWIQWIVRVNDEPYLTCVSRGGELTRISIDAPERGATVDGLSLLPTAAMPWGHGILLGTTEGLVYWERDRQPQALSVPVTRSAVLCLDRLRIPLDGDAGEVSGPTRDFVIMGLDSGRLRVINEQVLNDLVVGHPAQPDARSYAVELGSGILAVEVLKPHAHDPSRCFLLAALRDHSLRLFHVDRREHVEDVVARQLAAFAASRGSNSPLETWDALLEAASSQDDRDAVKFLLLDVVFPELVKAGVAVSELSRRVVAMIPGSSTQVLHRVSRGLSAFAGNDADTLLEVSLSLLEAMPRDHASERSKFVTQHLKALHEAARKLDAPADQPGIISWTRFVRKYVLLGNTFAEKALGLRDLVTSNARTHKYLDALIYLAQLDHRRHDLDWRATVEGDLHSLHVTERLVIAAARDGRLWFFDRSGWALGAFGEGGGQRLLAAAVVRDEGVEVLFAVSRVSLTSKLPELSVLTLARAEGRPNVTVTARRVEMPGGIAVCGLSVLPNQRDPTVLAALDNPEHLYGLVHERSGRWQLAIAPHPGARTSRPGASRASDSTRPDTSMLNPGEARSRTVAVISLAKKAQDDDGAYLATLGSDDGVVSLIWFHHPAGGKPAPTIRCFPLVHPISAVALDVTTDAGGHELPACTSYVGMGTSMGEVFASDVPVGDGDGGVEVRPVWRETYDQSVLAITPWTTPLYPGARVVATVTAKGRLCLYDCRLWTHKNEPELSETNNYRFRSVRLDRISLPSPLTCFTLIQGTCDFVAGGPGGQIYKGSIVYTRDSVDRVTDDGRLDEAGLPVNLRARFAKLRGEIRYGTFFFPNLAPDVQAQRERRICELVHLEGGAFQKYLVGGERWGTDGAKIEQRARVLLDPLRPQVREERDQIKTVLQSLAREVLDESPAAIIDQVRALRTAARLDESLAPAHDAVRAAVSVLRRQIAEAAWLPASHAGRIRIVAFKELFRVQVLRHAAVEKGGDRPIQAALQMGLNTCLRDEDPLVLIEALRAVGLTLRNVTVIRERLQREDPDLALALMAHLFPEGVAQLFWMADPITEKLSLYPTFTATSVVSMAWYYLAVLWPIFRLFPRHTLEICNRITSAGVSTGTLEVLERRLEGSSKWRAGLISKLYLVPSGATARADFTASYKAAEMKKWFEDNLPDLGFDTEGEAGPEVKIARRLVKIYDWLASCWGIDDPDRLPQLGQAPADPSVVVDPEAFAPRVGEVHTRSPIGTAEQACAELLQLARELWTPQQKDDDRRAAIKAFRDKLDGHTYRRLTSTVRGIVGSILDHWLSRITDKPPPGKGDTYAEKYVLGDYLGWGGYGTVHEVQGSTTTVIKIFNHRYDDDSVKRKVFLQGAYRNRQLSSPSHPGIVRLIEIVEEHERYPGYVMERCNLRDLAGYLGKDSNRDPEMRVSLALWIAADVGAGLAYAHKKGIVHGDIHARNILVHLDEGTRRTLFKLGDFDLASGAEVTRERRWELPPPSISRPRLRQPEAGKWTDAVALARVLYNVLTGLSIGACATEEELAQACASLARISHLDLRPLLTALRGVLGDPEVAKIDTASDFLARIAPGGASGTAAVHHKLEQSVLHDLHKFLIQVCASRMALLSGIGAGVVATLPVVDRLNEQLMSDLNLLNGWLTIEPDPMVTLLNNARAFAAGRDDAVVDTALRLRSD